MKGCAKQVDGYVRDNPRQALAIAGGVALLVGILMGRRQPVDERARRLPIPTPWEADCTSAALRGLFATDSTRFDAADLTAVEVELYLIRVVQMLLRAVAALALAHCWRSSSDW